MNIVFMGTPEFAAAILQPLAESHNVAAAVTQPDKPVGRGNKVQQPPVKQLAASLGIPVLQPEKPRSKAFYAELASYAPDAVVVAAYGRILAKAVLEMPPLGCINVHASLLPKYRGAAPIQWAIINGEPETGVTIMRMDEGIDTGGVMLQSKTPIAPGETYGSLRQRLAEIGAVALLDALRRLENGGVPIKAQSEAGSSYAPMITNETCRIEWNSPTARIINLIRALNPEPGAVLPFEGMKAWRAELYELPASHKNAPPGEIIQGEKRGLAVKTADSAVLITELQAKAGKRMPAADYLRGHKLPTAL